jgi:hypothetical protein
MATNSENRQKLLDLRKNGYNINIINSSKNKIQFGIFFYIITLITILYGLLSSWILSTKSFLGIEIPTEIVVLNLLGIIIVYSLIIIMKYYSLSITDVFIFFCMSIAIVPIIFFIYIILKLKFDCPKPDNN